MKKHIAVIVCSIGLYCCNGKSNEQNVTREEKKELEKVETFKKTDKEKEDSVMTHWQKKMEESKVGE